MPTYRQFIDELVTIAQRGVPADRIRAQGHPVRTNESALPLDTEEAAQKAFFLALSSEQRELLVRLIMSERKAAVHDVLAYLEWASVTEALDVVSEGESFTGKASESMHGDFIARMDGWEWGD